MKISVAVDSLKGIKKIKDKEIIYVYDEEKTEDLIKLGLHCIHKDYIKDVDINTTKYDIPCIKKCKIDDDLSIEEKNYKFAIIVPNYNNAHRKI